jgi:hypothetical protein
MKDINLEEALHQHKSKLINAAIVILALLVAYNIYQKQRKDINSLIQKKETEIKKNAVLADIQQLEKKILSYKKFVNNKDISVVMNTVSEIAKLFSINVISIRPETRQENPLYVRHFFTLKLEIHNYHALGKFVSGLESHHDLYSVERLEMRPQYSYGGEKKGLYADLTISTILLKD